MDDEARLQLTGFRLFEGLTPIEMEAVMACGRIVNFAAGEKVIEESDESWDLYVVLDGRISIEMAVRHHSAREERRKQLALFRKGEVFGDMAFLRGARRSASVTTVDDFTAMVFDRDLLYRLFEEDNRIGYIMVRNLACIMSERVMELNFLLRNH
jgi:CRP-like cAMP-binding protein